MDEILDEIKLQMEDKDIKVKDVYRILDGYSRRELIDNGSFIRTLKHDLKFHLDQIDLDFICKVYRDRKDKRSVRYSSFMDDLKQKFELTETYLVPGERRKNPNISSDPLADRTFSRKDFATPKKDEDIKIILNELRTEVYDKEIDLKKEFEKYSRDGMLREDEFKEVFKNYRLQIDPDDIAKLVDKYINTFGETIDTNIMLDQIYEKIDSYREYSSNKNKLGSLNINTISLKIAKKLEKKGISKNIIRNLEKADRDNNKYLSFKDIKGAFHREKFELSTKQVEELLSEIKQNRHREYNYHILLCSLFGENYKNEISVGDHSIKTTPKFTKSKSLKRGDRKKEHSKFKRDKSDELSSIKSSGRSRSRDSRRSKSRNNMSERRSKRKNSDRKSKSKHSERRHGQKRRNSSRSKSKSRHHGSHSKSRKRSKSRRRDSKDSRSRSRKSRSHRSNRRDSSKSDRKGRSKSRKESGTVTKYIGNKLVSSKYDYMKHLHKYAGDDRDFVLTEEQIFKIVNTAGISLSSQDKRDFVKDMDGTKFTVEEFLINCQLETDGFEAEGLADEVVLTTEEEEDAKKHLEKVGLAIEDEKSEFENIFNVGPYDKTVDFAEFKYGLLNELNSD